MTSEKIEKHGATVSVQASKHSYSIVQFGLNLRRDGGATYKIAEVNADTQQARILQDGRVPKDGKLKLHYLKNSANYLVIAMGAATAGVVTTAELNLKPPFHLSMDAPAVDKQAMKEAVERASQAEAAEKARPKMAPLAHAIKRAGRTRH